MAISQATEALPEYRRVWCQGELLHERSIFVGPRPRTVMGSAKSPGQHLVLRVAAAFGRADSTLSSACNLSASA